MSEIWDIFEYLIERIFSFISSTYLIVFKILDNFLKLFSKILKQYLHRLFYSTIFALFVYQFYDITHQYFRFKHSIDLQFAAINSVIPSITQCVYPRHRIYNESYVLIDCNIDDISRDKEYFCGNISETVYVRYRKNTICLTYLSNITEQEIKHNLKIEKTLFELNFGVEGFKRSQFIVHDHFTPSHFETNNVFILSNEYKLRFRVKKSTKNYLPHPYSTDCRDYSYHRSNEIGPNILGEKDYLTRSGCMLASIRRKYKANNCDYGYWTEYVIGDMSQINWTKTFTDTECENKVNFKEIERNCKIECQHTDYFVTAIKIKRNKVKSELYQLTENHLIEN